MDLVMQVKCRKVHKYLGMTLDCTTVGQVTITILEYIDEILDTFGKAYPMGGGTKSSYVSYIIFKVNKDCKQIMPNKLFSFITWWQKYYLLPSRPGQTHVPQSHSLPQD